MKVSMKIKCNECENESEFPVDIDLGREEFCLSDSIENHSQGKFYCTVSDVNAFDVHCFCGNDITLIN